MGNRDAAKAAEGKNTGQPSDDGTTWGPRLFWASVAFLLAFFWWLLIYSGGVATHHG